MCLTVHPNHQPLWLEAQAVVGGGAVEWGDREVVEAEVDAELRTVVDEVVEEHGAVEDGAG